MYTIKEKNVSSSDYIRTKKCLNTTATLKTLICYKENAKCYDFISTRPLDIHGSSVDYKSNSLERFKFVV